MRVGARTDLGLVREQNEDAYGYRGRLFVVADGMGGHQAGEIASAVAVETILDKAEEYLADDIQPGLLKLILQANQSLLDKIVEDPVGLEGMGTTITVLLLSDQTAFFTNIGDSRIYRYSGHQLIQLSTDHSLVAELVRNGELSAEVAKNHPQRNILTRALGAKDLVPGEVGQVEIALGDRFLLCTDGLTNLVDEFILAKMLALPEEPQVIADKMVTLAKELGGNDNITVLIVEV